MGRNTNLAPKEFTMWKLNKTEGTWDRYASMAAALPLAVAGFALSVGLLLGGVNEGVALDIRTAADAAEATAAVAADASPVRTIGG